MNQSRTVPYSGNTVYSRRAILAKAEFRDFMAEDGTRIGGKIL